MLMKSKIYTLIFIFIALTSFTTIAQNQPVIWYESGDESNDLEFYQETTNVNEGTYSLRTDLLGGVPYIYSGTFDVTEGVSYTFSVDVLDNVAARYKIYCEFLDASDGDIYGESPVYSTDNADWQTINWSATVPTGAVKAYVWIKIYEEDGFTSPTTLYLDNVSFVENGGSNLVPNAGFEGWEVEEGSTVDNWKESLYTPSLTSVIAANHDTVSEGFTSLKYTFTDDGTPYFICDTFEVTADASFTFDFDFYVPDDKSEMTTRIYFFDASGEYISKMTSSGLTNNPSWQTISQTGTVPSTAVKAYVLIRMLTGSGWDGSATFYADNASYTEGGSNLIVNGSFENWTAPAGTPEILTYKFEELDPVVTGIIDKEEYAVDLEVPYSTDVTSLVATFTLTEGATATVGTTEQVSGTTPNDFTNAVTYSLTGADDVTQDWTVTVAKEAPTTGNDIITFKFEALDPTVTGAVLIADHTVDLEVPFGTDVTTLVPTITLSENATISPESGVAQDFSSAVTYTVTAQDGTTQNWTVTVTEAAEGQTILFFEDFEDINLIPNDWYIINNDGYTQATGEERWQDSAWVVTTTNRDEFVGTKLAMASSYTSDMPNDGKADDWMILPSITIGDNSILSWQAMSTTSSGNYPDDYMVLIAPAVSSTDPTISYFEQNANILIEVEPESWSASVSNPGEGISNQSINLKDKGWTDQDVWIAFVLTTDLYTNPTTGEPNSSPGGSNLAVDNIKVVNESSSTSIGNKLDRNNLEANIYPNPTTGEFKIVFNSEISSVAEVEIYDITGRVILNTQHEVSIGQNELELSASDFISGIYLISTKMNNYSNVTKLIVK